MKPEDWPDVSVVEPGTAVECITALKARKGKDIWFFGGGQLAGLCFQAGLVDTVETAVILALLAGGVRLIEMTSEDGWLTELSTWAVQYAKTRTEWYLDVQVRHHWRRRLSPMISSGALV